MKNNKKQLLEQSYAKSLKAINKNFFDKKETGLTLFAEYLRYLRDITVLDTIDELFDAHNEVNLKVATISAAIAELDAYIFEEVQDKKVFHWNNFCELIRLNMEEWLETNDSI